MSVKIDWRKQQVRVEVANMTAKIAAELVNVLEGQTKVNIRDNGQIDTGFMVNSVYAVSPTSSDYAQAKSDAEQQTQNRASEAVDHTNDMAPEVGLDNALAAICVGASYAVYQEAHKSFLYKAILDKVPEFGGIVKLVKR